MNRRKFIRDSSLLSTSSMMPSLGRSADNWSGGQIQHLIPLSNHDRILLKVSFVEPQQNPSLRIGQTSYAGVQTDTLGRFWTFHADGLESNQDYELTLQQQGNRYADSWSLSTTPAPTADAETMRVLVFTCGGGPDEALTDTGVWRYLPVSTRQRLLQRGLSYAPDLAVGIGDQVYWDQNIARRWRGNERTQANRERIWGKYGSFDEDLAVFGTANEATLTGCLDEQIASLYRTTFKSVPLILTQDDHDYFENDEGTDDIITFPPRNFTARLGRASQALYFPEFLPEINRPAHLVGSSRNGISESYGSYRWGSLLELLLYDCRRFITLAGPTATFIEEQTERWMASRTAAEETRHLIHIPSTPFGWSAGKWGEWYPDYLQANGQLGLENPKPYWQEGWFAQHQRILASISEQDERIPIILSGDLHAIGSGLITRSGDLNLDNPVHTILAGPIGTGTGWPSSSRGIGATVPLGLEVEERVHPIENNGFSLFDIDADSIEVRQFAWLPEQGLDAIDNLQPFSAFRLTR
ncbi:MAG: alkaline phosphatase D family protein [Proteobacteria bacterium]|nr:alkaline phosphatase D family protein [Pseudomonadota bacterium]